MRMKFVAATVLLLSATGAQAGLGSLITKKLQQVAGALQDPKEVATASGSPTMPSPGLGQPALAEPQRDPSVTDRFVTRKDAHGHDYDAKTGLLICLAKPRNYKAGAYAMSYSQTNVPEGHNPNLSCISADREFTKT